MRVLESRPSRVAARAKAQRRSEVKYIDRHIHRSYYLREVVRSAAAVLRSYGEELFAFESIVAMCGEEGEEDSAYRPLERRERLYSLFYANCRHRLLHSIHKYRVEL